MIGIKTENLVLFTYAEENSKKKSKTKRLLKKRNSRHFYLHLIHNIKNMNFDLNGNQLKKNRVLSQKIFDRLLHCPFAMKS